MRRSILTLCLAAIATGMYSKTVDSNSAQTISVQFLSKNSKVFVSNTTLAYTETSPTGEPVYYVFNINKADGFVIVAADDAAHPIIGYSTKGIFVKPAERSNVGNWLNKRKKRSDRIAQQKYNGDKSD